MPLIYAENRVFRQSRRSQLNFTIDSDREAEKGLDQLPFISMNLVFAHFGKKLPSHLIANLKRTVSNFPAHSIFLICDQSLSAKKIKGVEIIQFNHDDDWKAIEELLAHPLEFRDGFWMKSLGRFLALNYFMTLYDAPILHIESDVLLAGDFPFEEILQLEKNFAFPLVSHQQGIASTLFIRNQESAATLKNLAIQCCTRNMNATDMTILGDLQKSFPSEIQVLPTGPRTILASDVQGIPQSISSLECFSGFFDGLDFGYFLFGIDPRNHRGLLIKHQHLSGYFIDANLANFVYNPEREFLDIICGSQNETKPIYSLHIHSKRAKIFRSQRVNSDFHLHVNEFFKRKNAKVIPSIFLKSLLQALIRRIVRLVKESG